MAKKDFYEAVLVPIKRAAYLHARRGALRARTALELELSARSHKRRGRKKAMRALAPGDGETSGLRLNAEITDLLWSGSSISPPHLRQASSRSSKPSGARRGRR